MSEFSDRMAATALRLITQYGEAITLTRATPGAYDPTTGTTAAGSTANYNGFGVPIDYDQSEKFSDQIKQGDSRLFINAVSTIPQPADTLTLDSIVYRVMDVRKYTINSEHVLYELQLRV